MSKTQSAQSHPSVNRADLIRLYRRALESGISFDHLDEKIKESWLRAQLTEVVERENDLTWQVKLWNVLPAFVRWGAALVPALMILAGIGLVGSAVWPIASYYFQSLTSNTQTAQLLAPVPQEKILDVVPLVVANGSLDGEVAGDSIDVSSNELEPIVVDAKLDYTNLNNWFSNSALPFVQGPDLTDETITEYRLDIPKVDIVNAVVKVGTDDLNKNLIQYQGTAMPGKAGSPVIFGHSILRQFYNPKESNPRRYMSIFSKIMTLQKGDRIYLTVNGAQYTYVVEEKTEVQPTDTFILAQRYDVKQLKLVTCVPEGTYLRRGVVTARLITND